MNALSALSFRPELISPDGAIKKPKYLYCLVESILFSPQGKDFLICLPFLLKTITLVLSTLMLMPFFSVYNFSVLSIFDNPTSDFDKSRISSAHIIQPRGSAGLISTGSFSSFSSYVIMIYLIGRNFVGRK